MLNRLLRLAAFQNPEFYKAQAMRLPTYDKPRVIACGQELAQHIAVPRGCLTETLALLEAHKIRTERGDYNIAPIHLADAIEILVVRSRESLSGDDRSPKDPYRAG